MKEKSNVKKAGGNRGKPDKSSPARDNGGGKEKLFAVLTGVFSGLANGLFGGGGGMIVVPMLAFLLKMPSKNAHATAIFVILPLSLLSGLFYAAFGHFRWQVGLPVTVGVIAGGIAGALLLKKMSSKWVIILFSAVMAAAGVKMLFF